ncbi:MAG TPA: histone deacetylase [Vicinamibacteria bacterium]|nr:histone deacetylase [Vicinamibacteria bacterium]
MSLRVGLYDDPLFRRHDAGPGHPERPERLDALRRGLAESGQEEALDRLAPPEATRESLERVHTRRHVDEILATRGRTVRFDADTQAGPESCAAALRAAGAVTDAVDRVLDGRLDRAFCAVRPPGHHAEAERAMGFCYLNNVAVGAAQALARGLDRVLVVDFDVHHGNGTQAAFWSDPRVLYVSSHQYPFYPGSGAPQETGAGKGRGFTVNLALPAGCGDAEYAALYHHVVVRIGRSFDPQLVLVSAGFDAHVDDPLAGMRLTPSGFGEVMSACLATAEGAARGRVVVALEGGYDLDGIAASAAEVVRRLRGGAAPAPSVESPSADRLAGKYRRFFADYWPLD